MPAYPTTRQVSPNSVSGSRADQGAGDLQKVGLRGGSDSLRQVAGFGFLSGSESFLHGCFSDRGSGLLAQTHFSGFVYKNPTNLRDARTGTIRPQQQNGCIASPRRLQSSPAGERLSPNWAIVGSAVGHFLTSCTTSFWRYPEARPRSDEGESSANATPYLTCLCMLEADLTAVLGYSWMAAVEALTALPVDVA